MGKNSLGTMPDCLNSIALSRVVCAFNFKRTAINLRSDLTDAGLPDDFIARYAAGLAGGISEKMSLLDGLAGLAQNASNTGEQALLETLQKSAGRIPIIPPRGRR